MSVLPEPYFADDLVTLALAISLLGVRPVLRRPAFRLGLHDRPPVADLLGGEVAAMNLPLDGIAARVRLCGYLSGGQHVIRVTELRRREQVDYSCT